MDWKSSIRGFTSYLKLEKSLSENSVVAYESDIDKLRLFSQNELGDTVPNKITMENIQLFLKRINDVELAASTQSRILSGLKSFFKYLVLEDVISESPADLIEAPKLGRKLPDTLSIHEIHQLIDAIDLSHPQGMRNKAMLEVLYSCGLRVSELVNLKISGLYFDDGFIRVIGKGDKERLVPVGKTAIKFIRIYLDDIRVQQSIQDGYEDFVFLNRRGKGLTRVMIFTIIKDLALVAGLKKNISPHTFRHSFASHMVEAGADLRAVQEMLGHESITTTEIYTHLDRDYLRQEILEHHPRNKT